METLEPPIETMQTDYLAPPKTKRVVANKPTLLKKAFVTPQPLSWMYKLLCPHSQSQTIERTCCTLADLLQYIMLLADLRQRSVTGEGHQALNGHCNPESV